VTDMSEFHSFDAPAGLQQHPLSEILWATLPPLEDEEINLSSIPSAAWEF